MSEDERILINAHQRTHKSRRKGAEEDSPERIRVGFIMPDVPIKGTGNSDELVTIRIVRALDA